MPIRRRTAPPRNIRLGNLSVVRKVMSSSPVTFTTASTSGFYQYLGVALTNGFQSFTATPTTICSLTNLAEYAVLFEQYKLNAYKIELFPRYQDFNTNQNTSTATVRNVPMVYICKDPHNTVTYTGTWSQTFLNGLLENGGKCYRGDKKITLFVKPKVSEQFGGGALRYIKPQWTDLTTSAGQGVYHRGYHMMVYSTTWDNASLPVYDVMVTYYLQFRNPR